MNEYVGLEFKDSYFPGGSFIDANFKVHYYSDSILFESKKLNRVFNWGVDRCFLVESNGLYNYNPYNKNYKLSQNYKFSKMK